MYMKCVLHLADATDIRHRRLQKRKSMIGTITYCVKAL